MNDEVDPKHRILLWKHCWAYNIQKNRGPGHYFNTFVPEAFYSIRRLSRETSSILKMKQVGKISFLKMHLFQTTSNALSLFLCYVCSRAQIK